MAQFDVFDLGAHGLVVDCQSDLLSHLRSRLIVPLRPEGDLPVISQALNPIFEVNGRRYVLAAQFPRAVDLSLLRQPVASLSSHDLTIKRALDLAITGV